MNDRKILRAIEFEPTPKEMARVFCEWHSGEQAAFLLELNRIVRAWTEPGAAVMQAHYIGREIEADTDAVAWLSDIVASARYEPAPVSAATVECPPTKSETVTCSRCGEQTGVPERHELYCRQSED